MPGTYNFTINQGETISRKITWQPGGTPQDITGYSARMHVRRTKEDVDTVIELTDANGRLVLGGSAGTITVTLSDTESSAIEALDYVYDLELISPGGVVKRLLEGPFEVTREVTR
jgi:hypothetical protein